METPKTQAPAVPSAYAEKLVGMSDLKSGYTVRVHELIKDVNSKGEEKERVQIFEGMILTVRGTGASKSFTVRKSSDGYGVEKIYPIFAPIVSKVEFVKAAKVRRAKLAYLSNPKKPFGRQMKEHKAPAKKA